MDKNFLEDIKRLFKSKQRVSEEDSQKVKKVLESEKDILDALKQLEKEYQNSKPQKETVEFPEKIEYNRIKGDFLSDEEIEKQAKEQNKADYIKDFNDIDMKAVKDNQKLSEKAKTAESDKINTLQEIDELFKSMQNTAKSKAMKQGIQRSSIISENLKDLKNAKEQGVSLTEKDFKSTIEKIDSEMDLLDTEREKALENLNLLHANEVTETINKLKAERDKLANELITKNNKISKDELKANEDLARKKADYINRQKEEDIKQEKAQAEYEKEYGYTSDKQQNYAERYNIALDFYMSVDPGIALDALNASANMKHYLGNYYEKLQNVLKERSKHTNKYF